MRYGCAIRKCPQLNKFFLIILIHQIAFQGMFFAKNVFLGRKLRKAIKGKNREANLSIGFLILFILGSLFLGFFANPNGSENNIMKSTAMAIALPLLAVNIVIGALALIGLGDSWRVGVLEDQQTDLVIKGIYRFSRNPYFLSYLVMFIAYTVLLQSMILLLLSLIGFVLIHRMVLKEENHLTALHGKVYRQYKERVPRYFLV